jgi:hypothetical protein
MIKLFATLCSLATGVCHEQSVTNTNFDERLTGTLCPVAIPQLAEWMQQFPQYRFAGWRCQMGERERIHS